MEYELMMREPWQFPRESGDCAVQTSVNVQVQPTDEDASTRRIIATTVAESTVPQQPFTAWEENFQDLSSWCMANAQARCDFPTGESAMAASKLTGTINEGRDVMTTAEGTTSGFMQAIGRKAVSSGKDMIVNVGRPESVTCVIPPQLDHAYTLAGQEQQQQQQQQQTYYNNNNNNNNRTSINNNISAKMNINDEIDFKNSAKTWMGMPLKAVISTVATASTTTSNSIAWPSMCDLGNVAVTTGLPVYQSQQQQQQQQSPAIDVATKTEPQVQARDNQDVFQMLETDTSNEFDLLSYLCEGDIPSPGDSVSTCSSRLTDANNLPRLEPESPAHIIVSPKTYEPITLSTSTATDTIKSHLQATTTTTTTTTTSSSSTARTLDSPYSHESSKHSPNSSTSSDVAISSRLSSRQLRTIVKIEKPDSPPPIHERRITRPRRTRTNSIASQSSSTSGRGRGKKRNLDEADSESEDETYREVREKNNEASRKSRMNKKAKEMEMAKRALELEKDNRILKMKVEELEKLVSSMRNALLRSALKREVKPNMF